MTKIQVQAQSEAHTYAQTLGEEKSVWFKMSPLIDTEKPMGVLLRMTEKYGGCIPINIGAENIYFLSDVDHIRHVLVNNVDNYVKYFDGLKPIFGKSMITVDGVLWQKIRKPQQPFFHPQQYSEYLPYFLTSVRTKAADWGRFAKTGETVELLEQTWGLAADMICRALFDREMPFNPHVVFNMVKAYTEVENHRSIQLKKAAGGLQEVGDDEAPVQAIGAWLTLPEAVISARPWQGREDTLLNMLLAAEADPSMPEFDRQQVMDEMKQYLWAGTETTALTLVWCLYLLSQHPEVAEKIRREGKEVYGEQEPDWEDIQELTYTRSVVLETLRLYPPVWSLIRSTVAEDEIAGHRIMPGDRIVMSTYVLHHNPKYWSEPETFRPERFEPGAIKNHVKYSYLPFGGGKRVCVGGQMAQLEVVLALTMLLRRFRPEYLGDVPVKIDATVTLVPKGGLAFRFHELS